MSSYRYIAPCSVCEKPYPNAGYLHTRCFSSVQPLLERGEAYKVDDLRMSHCYLSEAFMKQLTHLQKLTITLGAYDDEGDLSFVACVSETLEELTLVIQKDRRVILSSAIARCRKLRLFRVETRCKPVFAAEIGSLARLTKIEGCSSKPWMKDRPHDWHALQREWACFVATALAELDQPARLPPDLANLVLSFLFYADDAHTTVQKISSSSAVYGSSGDLRYTPVADGIKHARHPSGGAVDEDPEKEEGKQGRQSKRSRS